MRTIRQKSFWFRTLSIPLLIAAVLALSFFSSKATDEASQEANRSPFTFMVLDTSGFVSPELVAAAGGREAPAATAGQSSRDEGIRLARTGQVEAFFYYPSDPSKEPVQIYAADAGITDNSKYEAVATQLLQAGVTQAVGGGEKVALLQHGPSTTLVTYKDGEPTKGFGRVIVPGLFLILFYAVIVLLGNQMLTSTTEEKENRVIEMILTSVSARTIIIGKIIALIALGGIQILAILVPVAVAYFGFRSQLHIPALDLNSLSFAPAPIAVGAAIFIGGFMLFTGLLVAIGSAVPTAKEAGGFFAFAMILVFVPFYALGAIATSPDQIIVKVMTFFPLTAPITLMLRNAVGNLSPLDTAIGLVILYVSAALLMALAIRIFRFGSLEYARKLGIKEILTRKA